MADTITFLVLTTLILMAFTMTKTDALIPYTRPLWDLMDPTEDPFKILEQTPFNLPKNLDNINLARADWKETSVHHVISLDVPGVKREDMKIEVEENRVLRVTGERKPDDDEDEDRDKWHRAERRNGKFWRQFRLPENAAMEKIMAHLQDGVLKIKVPKLVQERKPSKIIDIVGEGSPGEDIRPTKLGCRR